MTRIFLFMAMFMLSAWTAFAQSSSPKEALVYVCPDCGSSCDTLTFDKPGTCPHCGMALIVKEKPITVCFYLQDGVEILDFAGPMEVFSYAGFKVFTVSRTKAPIVAQGILKVIPDYSIADAPPSDVLAFFGGNSGTASGDTAVIRWIIGRKASTRYVFSVCTGAFIVGKAGLLDGLTATTFHSRIDELRKALPKTTVLSGVRFVDNGTVITTAGISAGIDGALYLMSKLKGADLARETARYMEYDKWVPDQGLIITGK